MSEFQQPVNSTDPFYNSEIRQSPLLLDSPVFKPITNMKRIFRSAKDAIILFKTDPVKSLGFLMVVTAKLLALGLFLFSFITFAFIDNGYGEQFAHLANWSIGSMFTTGAVSVYYNQYIMLAIAILLTLALIACYIVYIKNASKPKKIVFISLLSLSSVMLFFLLPALVAYYFFNSDYLIWVLSQSETTILNIVRFFFSYGEVMHRLFQHTVAVIIAVVFIFAFPVVTYIMLGKGYDTKGLFLHWFMTILEVLIILPLLLLCVKNIIPLTIVIVIGGIVILLLKIFASGSSESGEPGGSSPGGSTSSGVNKTSRDRVDVPSHCVVAVVDSPKFFGPEHGSIYEHPYNAFVKSIERINRDGDYRWGEFGRNIGSINDFNNNKLKIYVGGTKIDKIEYKLKCNKDSKKWSIIRN